MSTFHVTRALAPGCRFPLVRGSQLRETLEQLEASACVGAALRLPATCGLRVNWPTLLRLIDASRAAGQPAGWFTRDDRRVPDRFVLWQRLDRAIAYADACDAEVFSCCSFQPLEVLP